MRPFRRDSAVLHGHPLRKLYSGSYTVLFPGVLIHASVPLSLVTRARAALLASPPGAVLSHQTAARLWHGSVPDDHAIHLSYAKDVKSAIAGITTHRFRAPFGRGLRHGLPVTSPEQTITHLARHLGLVDLVALADSFVRRGHLTPAGLAAYARDLTTQGASTTRRVAQLCRTDVDSAPETRVRLLLIFAGLPEPVVNHPILRPDGTVQYRLDLAYPIVRLAIEYDGRWHEAPAERLHDQARRADLRARGWTVIVLTSPDLYDDTAETIAALAQVLHIHGIVASPAVGEEWRKYFAERGLVA